MDWCGEAGDWQRLRRATCAGLHLSRELVIRQAPEETTWRSCPLAPSHYYPMNNNYTTS